MCGGWHGMVRGWSGECGGCWCEPLQATQRATLSMGITLVPALLPALHCPVWPALLCLLALQLIATSLENRQPCLFFCKLGKDRTGLMAALVLAACGLSEEEIVADYVRCGAVLWAARLLCWGGDIGSACQRRCAYVRVMFWRCAAALPACLPDLPIRLPACLPA